MTREQKRPNPGAYLAMLLLLIAAYCAFFMKGSAPSVSYARVEELFRSEQVESFFVKNDTELYLTLRDGAVVSNRLGSVDAFRREMGDLIQDQKDRGILVDYDYQPAYLSLIHI